MLGRTEVAHASVRFAFKAFHKRSSKPRFANTCLAGQEHYLAFASLCLRPAPQQQFEFFLSPNKLGQSARVQRLEAAFDRSWSQGSPGFHRTADAFEVFWTEVLKIEEIAKKPSRALSDDDGVRLSNPLQPCRKVRRLADDAALLRLSSPDQIADYD